MFKILDFFSADDLEAALWRKMQRDPTYGRMHEFDIEELKRNLSRENREKLYVDYYQSTIKNIEGQANGDVEMIAAFRKIISMDLAYSKLALFAYNDNARSTGIRIPHEYIDENGIEREMETTESEVPVAGNYVVEIPYSSEKWLKHQRRPSELDPKKFLESFPYYYPGMNLILQGSGSIHRVAETFVNGRSGIAKVKKVNDSALYENFTTDGAWWISRNGNPVKRVGDFRVALMFTLAQKEKGYAKQGEYGEVK